MKQTSQKGVIYKNVKVGNDQEMAQIERTPTERTPPIGPLGNN